MFSRVSLLKVENDSGTGERDLINDGVGPGSPLLLDHDISARTVAHVYTPGLEQRDGLTGALHLFGVDAIGSVRTLINDDGNQMVTDTQSFDAYGITRSRTGSDWMAFGFAGADGYQTDPNELMLLGNREYHPFTGRFLTRDPAHAGSNDYEYCDDNPLRYADPSGLAGIAPGSVWAGNGPRGQDPLGQALNDYVETTWYLNAWQNGTCVGSIPIAWDYTSVGLPSAAFEHAASLAFGGVTAIGGGITAYASNVQYNIYQAALNQSVKQIVKTAVTTNTTSTTESWLWGAYTKTQGPTTSVAETTTETITAGAAEETAAAGGGALLAAGAGGALALAVGGSYVGYEGSTYLLNNTHFWDWTVNQLAKTME